MNDTIYFYGWAESQPILCGYFGRRTGFLKIKLLLILAKIVVFFQKNGCKCGLKGSQKQTRGCANNRCYCIKQGVSCTDRCRCINCQNPPAQVVSDG